MPITLTLTEGALTDSAIPQAIARITDAFLAAHALSGNKVITPNVTAHVNILPSGATFAGGKPVQGAWVETKTPSFALADRDAQLHFYRDATRILEELSAGTLSKDRIWSNGLHTVDGTWNLDGAPVTNAEFGAALAQG